MTIQHLRLSTTTKSCNQAPNLSLLPEDPPQDSDFPFSTSPHLKTYLESLHSYLNASASSPSSSRSGSLSTSISSPPAHNSNHIDKMGSEGPLAFTHFPKASTEFSKTLPLIGNENAFLGDIATRLVSRSLLRPSSTANFHVLTMPSTTARTRSRPFQLVSTVSNQAPL
jgi:hypothetical protein